MVMGLPYTENELLSLYFCMNLLQPLRGTPLRDGVESLLDKIEATFPDSLETTWIPVAIKEQMMAYSNLFGGSEVRVYGYGPSFYGGGGGAPNYSIKILGFNYETVRDIAEDLGRRLTRFSRIQDVDANSAGGWFTRDKASELQGYDVDGLGAVHFNG